MRRTIYASLKCSCEMKHLFAYKHPTFMASDISYICKNILHKVKYIQLYIILKLNENGIR